MLKKLLKERKLTMRQFSKITNTPYRTVQNWVNGVSRTPGIAIEFIKIWDKN